MAEQSSKQMPLSAEAVLKTEMIINQALIDILIAKQVITEEELVSSIQSIKREQQKLLNESQKIVALKR